MSTPSFSDEKHEDDLWLDDLPDIIGLFDPTAAYQPQYCVECNIFVSHPREHFPRHAEKKSPLCSGQEQGTPQGQTGTLPHQDLDRVCAAETTES